MEHIVTSAILNHLKKHKILCDQQHGFRKNRSCETQLLELADELSENMEKGEQTDILILDFAKAFDKVNHSLLLYKLHHYSVHGIAIAWSTNFLSNRRQAVVVKGTRSSSNDVHWGAPQGSVLGPCLFLAYINDLTEKLTSPTWLFVDDIAVYNMVQAPKDHDQLQQDLLMLINSYLLDLLCVSVCVVWVCGLRGREREGESVCNRCDCASMYWCTIM